MVQWYNDLRQSFTDQQILLKRAIDEGIQQWTILANIAVEPSISPVSSLSQPITTQAQLVDDGDQTGPGDLISDISDKKSNEGHSNSGEVSLSIYTLVF